MAYIVLILSSLRGGIFLLTGLPPITNIFFAITMVNTAFAVLPSRFFYYLKNSGQLNRYLKLLIINIIFGLIWVFGEIIIIGYSTESIRSFLLFFIIPFCVLLFIRAKDNNIVATIYFIAIIVSISCIIQFIICNIYPGYPLGLELVRGPLEAISPNYNHASFAHIGKLYRAHGITGHYHDSGNILTMASVYCIGYAFYVKKSILTYFLTLVVVTGLLSTLSMANIIAAIVGITIIGLYSSRGLFKRIFIIAVMGYLLLLLFQVEMNYFGQVSPDFDPSGRKMTSMMNLGSSSSLERITSIIFGHEHLSGISDMGYYTEFAILNMLTRFGIVTFIPLISLLCYPIYIFFISKKEIRREMWVPFVTVCTGLLTLWHYGSLFRSTSIFLFFAFYSMTIKKYLKERYQYKN